jgi:hypothetical protein
MTRAIYYSYLLALRRGRHNTHQKQPIGVGDNHQLRSMILQSPGHLGVGKHQEQQALDQPNTPN